MMKQRELMFNYYLDKVKQKNFVGPVLPFMY